MSINVEASSDIKANKIVTESAGPAGGLKCLFAPA